MAFLMAKSMLPKRCLIAPHQLLIATLTRERVLVPRGLYGRSTITKLLTTSTPRIRAEPNKSFESDEADALRHKEPPSRSSKFWDSVVGWAPIALLGVAGLIFVDEYYGLNLLSNIGIQYDFFGPELKQRWAERRIWAAARAAGDDEAWRTACVEATRLRLRSQGLEFEEEEIPRRSFWGRGRGDILDDKDVRLFLVRDAKKVVQYFCIVMNADPNDPNTKARTEATIKHVFDRRLSTMRETGRIRNACVWEYWTRDRSSGKMSWSWRSTSRSGNTDHDMLRDYFSSQKKP